MNMRKKQAKAITMIQLGVAGVLLLLLVLLVYWYVEGLSAYRPKTEVHQYFGGSELKYSATDVFRSEEKGIPASGDVGKRDVVDTPLLYKDDTKITIPCDMLLMTPKDGMSLKRINHFTTVSESSGRITYTSGKKSAQSYGGFLYDGNDLYVFLEPGKLTIGSTMEINLPALSYVNVKYGQNVEYHNSETDEDKVIGISNIDVTASFDSGYKLSLSKDVIYYDGNEFLLYSAVETIPVIEMK